MATNCMGKLGRKSRLLSPLCTHTARTHIYDNIVALVFCGKVQPCLHILYQAHVFLQHLQGKEECVSSLLQVLPAPFFHSSHTFFQGHWSHRLGSIHPKATSGRDKFAKDPKGSKTLLTKLQVLCYLISRDEVSLCQIDEAYRK